MRSAKSITNWLAKTTGVFLTVLTALSTLAQENSPYSRYGMGDLVPNQNIVSRGMGGLSAAYPNYLSINLNNPAMLGNISNTRTFSNTLFDIGGEADIRTLRSTSTPEKYKSVNALISYLQVAFPLSSKKMEKKDFVWAMSLGLRPLTRINYKIENNQRLNGIDSLQTVYEGSGGMNQVNISTGIRYKNFNFGISTGYTFGNRDYSTRLNFVNDSVVYYKSNYEVKSQFGGMFLNAGIFYSSNNGEKENPVTKKREPASTFNVGAFVNLNQTLNARRDKINETITFTSDGSLIGIDTVDYQQEQKGKIRIPMTYGVGISYQDKNRNWMFGADFESTNWSAYRFYNETDDVQNTWVIRAGAEYYPARAGSIKNKYWSYVKYRAGFYYGPDYIKLSQNRANYAASLGASFPLTSANLLRYGDYVLLHTSIEVGGRGNKQSQSFRESIMRFSFGISMNARWFRKRSYD